jgi:predicted lipoprotein with Yx(FWY)xxD motif
LSLRLVDVVVGVVVGVGVGVHEGVDADLDVAPYWGCGPKTAGQPHAQTSAFKQTSPLLHQVPSMNRKHSTLFSIIALVTLLSATLAANIVLAQTTTHGGMLSNQNGMTLYTFDKDRGGESHCYDGCAAAWPPFLVVDGAKAKGHLTVVARKGGAQQWAFDGKPLYTFAGDAKPGEAQGDGSGGVWHVIKAGAESASATKPSTYSTY